MKKYIFEKGLIVFGIIFLALGIIACIVYYFGPHVKILLNTFVAFCMCGIIAIIGGVISLISAILRQKREA